MIGGRNREVAFFVPSSIPEVLVIALIRAPGVPSAFIGVDEIKCVLRSRVESNAVKNEELRFSPEVGSVGNSRGFQIGVGALYEVARITVVRFSRRRIGGVADHDERRNAEERIHECRIRVGNQEHVRFVDRCPSANRARVKSEPIRERVFAEFADGVADVLPKAGNVNETKIENLRAMLFRKFQYAFSVHSLYLITKLVGNDPPMRGTLNRKRESTGRAEV